MHRLRRHRAVTIVTLVSFLAPQVTGVCAAFGITGRDKMPEYGSFEPVATTNMVSLFDGGFTYNIPILEIPNGYPLSLSYHSDDVTTESLASWVGLGWTLNPGSISRVKRGFVDEFDGNTVTYYNRIPRNWTLGASLGGGLELFGGEKPKVKPGLNAEAGVRYNNYQGIGSDFSVGISGRVPGVGSLNMKYEEGRVGFGGDLNVCRLFEDISHQASSSDPKASPAREQKLEKLKKAIEESGAGSKRKERLQDGAKRRMDRESSEKPQISFGAGSVSLGYSQGSLFASAATPGETSYPTTVQEYNGAAFRFKVEVGTNALPVPIDVEGTVGGSYAEQDIDAETQPQVYGYMHLEDAYANEKSMMDYYAENEKTFEKRDRVLAVPLPDNDLFNVTGEALGGVFRPFRAEFGHYRKNRVKSETYMFNVGADVNFASIVTVPPIVSNLVPTYGGNLGGGYHKLQVEDWDEDKRGDPNGDFMFKPVDDYPQSNENVIFRFSGDLGGGLNLAGDEAPYRAGLRGFQDFAKADMSTWNYPKRLTTRDQTARSSYIAYHTMTDFGATGLSSRRYKVYQKNLWVVDVNGDPETYVYSGYNDAGIGEFATCNADGVRYVYGLPLHVKDEKNLQYTLRGGIDYDPNELNSIGGGITASIATGAGTEVGAKRKLGYSSPTPYASMHLLTQITSPDYVDRTMDGPTPDDFGSYTRFNYCRAAGGTSPWYPFRSPYKGVSFNGNSLSSTEDDMGSFSFGFKEIYYLHSIASKTHVAIFRLSDRDDGLGAMLDAGSGADDLITGSDLSVTPMRLRKLDRIDLYSLDDCKELGTDTGIFVPKNGVLPIKSVRFQYDYSLCDNVDNNANGGGKLTLRSLWFEYEGKRTGKISPYRFDYKYPNTADPDFDGYPAPYQGFENYGPSAAAQNPSYNVRDSDRWGYYRDFPGLAADMGALARFYPFVHQNPDLDAYDPAAWCLKRIVLPSGGELHVQYEQDDYQYVENRRAMVMVPLRQDGQPQEDKAGKRYYLDLRKIGISDAEYGAMGTADRARLCADLFEPVEQNRMYFSILYGLIQDPDPDKTTSEFIEGYSRIHGYGYYAMMESIPSGQIDAPFFVFKPTLLGGTGTGGVFHKIEYDTKYSRREIPQKVCKEFYRTQRRGILTRPSTSALTDDNAKAKDRLLALITEVDGEIKMEDKIKLCSEMIPEDSYVRVQMPLGRAKKGGGTRVKRLLMYDAGVASNDPGSLFGQEYDYTKTIYSPVLGDSVQVSSGVASNEPAVGRRENPFVNPINKDEQTVLEAVLYGRDMYAQEGPLGESLFPAPAVGYSRVKVSSIHEGKTTTGSEIHEFYTTFDDPFRVRRTGPEETNKIRLSVGGSVGGVSPNFARTLPFLSMGYSFIPPRLNGQPWRIAKYGADAVHGPIAEERYDYYGLSDTIDVMDQNFNVTSVPFSQFGVESEVLAERRQVVDFTASGNIELDLSGGTFVIPIIAVPVVLPTIRKFAFSTDRSVLRTHVTTKVVRYPAVLKSRRNKADGVWHTTENAVFDRFTGQPVVTKSYDDFSGSFVAQDFPASWSYAEMRSKAQNEGRIVNGSITVGGSESNLFLEFGNGNDCTSLSRFTPGDLLEIETAATQEHYLYHVRELDYLNNRVLITKSGMSTNSAQGVAVNDVVILMSGYTNQLNTKAGALMIHSTGSDALPFDAGPALTTNTFVDALNAELDVEMPGIKLAGMGTLEVTGSFPVFSIPSLAPYINQSCSADLASATITSVTLHVSVEAGDKIVIEVEEFDFLCDGVTPTTFTCPF